MKECNECLKQIDHGGKCYGKSDYKPCLGYERDPRGKKIEEDCSILVRYGEKIPNNTEITEDLYLCKEGARYLHVRRIREVKWDDKVQLAIDLSISCWYWSEGTEEEKEESKELPEKSSCKVFKFKKYLEIEV